MTSDSFPRRPLTLADAMILIAALAMGFALARPGFIIIAETLRQRSGGLLGTRAAIVSLAMILNIILLNFLMFLLPAFLLIRLRRPRVSWLELVRQPGFAACAALVAIFVALLPLSIVIPIGHPIEKAAQILLILAAPLAWVILIVTHRWNPEPSWIDRLGRVLGLAWTASTLYFVLIRVL